MSYTKTIWENLPSTNTPINKTNLNNMENGIVPANSIVVTDVTVNLNDYIHDGSYYFPGGTQTVSNIPAGINGWLRVMESTNNGFVKQIWYRAGTANSNDYQTYVRTYTGGSWSSWRRLVTENEAGTWTDISNSVVFNTNLVSSQECRCYVNESIKLCYVHLMVKAIAASSGSIVNSGLPKALSSLALSGYNITSNPKAPIQTWVRNVGDIRESDTLINNNFYVITGCYPYSSL